MILILDNYCHINHKLDCLLFQNDRLTSKNTVEITVRKTYDI